MPFKITLATLDPPTKRVPNPPPGQPVIATKAELRDGTRVTDSVGPTPVDPGAIDWTARLNRTAAGTPDASFDPATDIAYIGAFRIPFFSNISDGGSDLTGKDAFGFKRPEAGGRNGPRGSLFIGGAGSDEVLDGASHPAIWVSEVQIPDFSATSAITDHMQLPETSIIQNWTNVKRRAPIEDIGETTSGVTTADVPGALTFVGDTLYMSVFNSYDADAQNSVNVLICNDSKNLADSSYQGFLSRDEEDRGAIYSVEIPAEHQVTFGATHFCGIFATLSIMGRSSAGPALIGWNPASIQPSDTHVPATKWTVYSNTNPIDFWGAMTESTPINNHYTAELGTDLRAYLNSDPTTRISDPSTLPLPSETSVHTGSSDNTKVRCAFIPPGTDTVVFIGHSEGMKYGSLYKAKSWEQGSNVGDAPGWAANSIYDAYNFIWTMNLNDVASRVSEHDPRLIQQSLFEGHDGQRWRSSGGFRQGSHGVRGVIEGGVFDPDTGRLYLMHGRVPWTAFTSQYIVSVYQVGGGVN